jgi:hypothetical protein
MLIEGTNSDYTNKSVRISLDLKLDDELNNKRNFIEINVKNIVSSCNEFCRVIIQRELDFYDSSKTSYAFERYEQLEKDARILD